MMLGERYGRPCSIFPVPMGLPRKVFSAIFRTLTIHDFFQQHLHRIGVKDSPDCPLCLCGEAMNFVHLTVCASLANMGFNLFFCKG
ncbi:uncharacterized protein TNCV_2107191 [Trichonephila clavipes]|nr:uncharacterized protein TNCV_2107191 [Trichonephila clavipes]